MVDLEQRLARAGKAIDPGWDEAHAAAALAALHRRIRQRRTMMIMAPAALLVMGLAGGWLLHSMSRDAATGGAPDQAGRTPHVAPSGPAQPMAASPTRSHSAPDPRPGPSEVAASAGANAVAPAAGSMDPVGWSATPADEKSSVTLVAESSSEVLLALKGSGRFQADARSGRTLRVQVVEMSVILRSGRIEVEQRAQRVWLSVREGSARIDWDGQTSTLQAGEEGWFPRKSVTPPATVVARANPAVEPIAVDPPAGAAVPPAAAAAEAPAAVDPAPASDTEWRDLARRGDHEQAFVALVASGHVVRNDPEDLFLAADAARLSGHPEAALPYLDRVLSDHPQDPRAPVAAFTKGRVLLDLARFGDAANAFTLARGLAPDGALAEDALAREVEALSRAGQTARAHKAATEYVRAYPAGTWLRSVRRYGGL